MAVVRQPAEPNKRRRPPPTTPEARENQLINLSMELAERQLRDGTASAQVITHYLKLGSTREDLEQKRLQNEVELLKARVSQIGSAEDTRELIKNALDAMVTYTGQEQRHEYED